MALSAKEIGRRIREVRTKLGMPPSTVAEALGVDIGIVGSLEDGTLDPIPGDYVLIVGRLLATDFRYFISTELDDVEHQTRAVFRSLSDPDPNDLLAIRRFISFCMSERDLEELLSVTRSPLPPKYQTPAHRQRLHKDQGREGARSERRRLGLRNRPIENVFELIRSQGIRLFRYGLNDGDLSGVTVLHPRAGISVLLNYGDDLYRQFFSAAHEYGHVLFEREDITRRGCVVSYGWDKAKLIEIRANNFAAEFLLPTEALNDYSRPKDVNSLKSLIARVSRDYKVNGLTVAISLKELGWITERTLRSFKREKPVVIRRLEKQDPDIPAGLTSKQIEKRIAAIKEGISSYYLELLRRSLTEDKITFGRFAEMLDMTPDQASAFVKATRLAI